MGTSSPSGGPRPTTPLIPGWIPDLLPTMPPEQDKPDDLPDDNPPESDEDDNTNADDDSADIVLPNRYSEARSRFTAFSKNKSSGNQPLKDALKSYITKASGGPSTLARRMAPATARVDRLYTVINTFKDRGATHALISFNLANYTNKPLIDILSALTDVIFDDSSPYNNILDDSIAKLAYSHTINRIVETENIDLDGLTNENIEAMMSIFIEESIATKVICDIGVKLFEKNQDCREIIEIEETVYQIVSGLVRTKIMPEIIATQRGKAQNIQQHIENIYRIAFDCISETNA